MLESLAKPLEAGSEGRLLFRQLATAARSPLESLAELNNNTSLSISARACSHSLKLIQSDTVYELSFMLNPVKSKDRMKELRNRIEIYNLVVFPFIKSGKELKQNETLFLLVANVFNRTDRIVEDMISSGRMSGYEGGELLEKILQEEPAVEYQDADGEKVSIPPYGLLDHIRTVATAWGFDTGLFDERVQRIVSAQKQNLDLLKNREAGESVNYSVEDALNYRLETVGQYALLLASMAYPDDPEQQKYFAKIMMDIQRTDDTVDLLEDFAIQMNPYAALVSEYGLFNEYKNMKKLVSTWYFHIKLFLSVYGNKENNGVTLRDKFNQIRIQYQKGIDKEFES